MLLRKHMTNFINIHSLTLQARQIFLLKVNNKIIDIDIYSKIVMYSKN